MKKSLFNFLLLVAMVISIPMEAQNYGHHIVADGSSANNYIPVAGRFCNYLQKSQSVYPASMLTDLQDGVITTLRYYVATQATSAWTCDFQIKMGTISATTMTGWVNTDNFVTVYTGALDATDTIMSIELDVPYTYTGGNLVVEIANTSTGAQGNNSSFYCMAQTAGTWYCQALSMLPAGRVQNFLPKVDFYCEEVSCPKVTTINASEILGSSVTITWNPVSGAQGYLVSLNGGEEDMVTDTAYMFDELASTTTYSCSVRVLCSNGDTSAARNYAFTTPCGALEIPSFEDFENDGSLPDCWTIIANYTEGGSTQGVSVGRSGAYSGSYCISMKAQWNNTLAVAIATPLIAQPVNTIDVLFYAAGQYSSASTVMAFNTLEVGYVKSLQPNSTFYPVQTITFSREDAYDLYEVSFAGVEDTDSNVYVVFRRPGDNNVRPVKLDDVVIRTANPCANPQSFSFHSTASGEASFVWSDTVNIEWEIAYGPAGTDPDSMDRYASYISTQPYTITDLSNDTTYDFYFRAICGDTYSYWLNPVTVRPNSINMAHSGTSEITSCGISIFDDGGSESDYSTSSNSTLVIYPEGEDSVVRLTGTYNTEANFDFIYLYEGVGVDGLSLGTYSGTGVIDTVSSVGPITLNFHADGGTEAAGFHLIASCEERISCIPPYDLEVSNIAVTNARLAWTFNPLFPEPDHYSIALTNQATGDVSYYSATASPYTMLALLPATSYSVSVAAICASGDSVRSEAISFATRSLPCAGADLTQEAVDSLYQGTQTTFYLPSWSVYNYGLSQQVFRQEEMGDMGRITGMKFLVSAGSSTRLLNIYLGHASCNSLTEFIQPDDLTLVASGAQLFAPGREIEINFTTPFDYNGSDNLVLTIVDNTGSYMAGNYTYCSDIAPYTSVYAGTNNNPYNLNNLPASVSTTPQRMNVIWTGNPCSGRSSCVPPSVTASDILANAVSLTWLPGNSETAWSVEYKETMDEEWIVAEDSISATSATVTGLLPLTDYIFRVSALCGDDGSASASVSVSTPCGAYPLPFVENFDNGFVASSTSDSPFQACWNRICSYSYGAYPCTSESYALSGAKSLYFYNPSNSIAVAVLPMVDAPTDSLMVSFSAFKTGANHSINVGVMSDPNDFSTFTLVANVSTSAPNVWESIEVPLTNYQGTGRYIALASSENVSNFYIDNLLVDTYLPCPRVTGVSVDSVSLTSASLHWSASADTYQVQYGLYGFTLGEGTVLTTADTTITLTGLDNTQRYDVYVRGNCGADGFGHWSFATTFATDCGDIHAVPYHEDFNTWMSGSATLPHCWSNGNAFTPYLATTYDYYDNGASLYFSCSNAMRSAFVSLPECNSLIDLSDLEVSFAVRATSAGTLRVGFCDTPGDTSTFVPVQSLTIATGNSWHDYLVSFDNYNSTARSLTFIFSASSTASFYLDEVLVEPLSDCLRPSDLAVNHISELGAELSWTDHAGASQWQIEYGIYDPSTQQINSSTVQQVVASSNPFTLTGLQPLATYSFRVRAICGSGDTGYFSLRPTTFTMAQDPAVAPYSYDFEASAEWNEWQTGSNTSNVIWRRGRAAAASPTHAAYISSDRGATSSTVANVVTYLYRDMDFGADDTNFTLSFKARVGDNGNQTMNFKVFLADPATPVTASSYYYNAPWGAVEDIDALVEVTPDTLWTDYAVELPHMHGLHRLVFLYNNGNIAGSFQIPAQLDDIAIRYTTCPRPENLRVSNIGATTATVDWEGSASDYSIMLTQLDNSSTQQFNTSSTQQITSLTLHDLLPGTRYSVSVRGICSDEDSSLWSETVEFCTDCQSQAIAVFPWVEDFENGLSCWQQEMRRGNNAWRTEGYYENVGHMPPSGSNIAYLGHNTSGDSTMLISPVLAIANGAFLSFAHIQIDWLGRQDTLTVYYRSASNDSWHQLATYTDPINDWQTDTLMLPDVSSTYQIAFLGCDHYGYGIGIDRVTVESDDACSYPVILSRTVTHNAITLNWSGSASNYEYAIKKVSDNFFPMASSIASNSFSFSGLEADVRYVIRVRSLCGNGFASRWTYDTLLTHSVPCTAPEGLALLDSTYTTLTVDWTPTGLEQLWVVQLLSSRIGSIYDTVESHPYTFENLETGDSYAFLVQALCDPASGDCSPWSDTLYCSPLDCLPVRDITVGEITDAYLALSWTPGRDESSWLVEYGTPGFMQGLGLGTAIAESSSYRLSLAGFEPQTDYELYVYARCTETATSVPAGPVAFRTGNVGIAGFEGNAAINIYPNPTTGNTTISVSGISGKVTIDIVDMNGRTIKSTVQQISDAAKVNVEGLAQGAYFVRIYGEEINSIRKLIVR